MSGVHVKVGARRNAGVAQLVERNLAKVEVTSSSLVTRSKFNGRSDSCRISRLSLRGPDNAARTAPARVAKSVNAADLKSAVSKGTYGFKSRPGHQISRSVRDLRTCPAARLSPHCDDSASSPWPPNTPAGSTGRPALSLHGPRVMMAVSSPHGRMAVALHDVVANADSTLDDLAHLGS